jgi:hypoxanthine phosphoribosyltransferase
MIICKGILFNHDKIAYFAPSWEEMGEHCFALAKRILASGQRFDRLVTMAKGGWTWSRSMSDLLNIEEVASIQVKLYGEFTRKQKEPALIQALPISVKNERILLFDDVADSGESLLFAKNYLKMSGAKETITATLFYKPWSKLKPDFFVCQTKAWVIFPHEIREAVENIGGRWRKAGISHSEIVRRFIKIGLPEEQVKYFLKISNF